MIQERIKKLSWLPYEDTVFARINPSCRHCLRTNYSFCQPQRRWLPSCLILSDKHKKARPLWKM